TSLILAEFSTNFSADLMAFSKSLFSCAESSLNSGLNFWSEFMLFFSENAATTIPEYSSENTLSLHFIINHIHQIFMNLGKTQILKVAEKNYSGFFLEDENGERAFLPKIFASEGTEI